jgi:hypothetical protein
MIRWLKKNEVGVFGFFHTWQFPALMVLFCLVFYGLAKEINFYFYVPFGICLTAGLLWLRRGW